MSIDGVMGTSVGAELTVASNLQIYASKYIRDGVPDVPRRAQPLRASRHRRLHGRLSTAARCQSSVQCGLEGRQVAQVILDNLG